MEQHKGSTDLFAILRAAAPLQRASRHLLATLQEARELLVDDPVAIDARDTAGGLVRAVELLHNETRSALDLEIALQNEQQSKSAQEMTLADHRLNLLAAVFFPLVTLTGIFGMNLNSGLVEAIGERNAFWTVLGVGSLVGLMLFVMLGRPPRREARGVRHEA